MNIIKKTLILLPVVAMSLASCDDGGEYKIEDDGVYYSYWTFSFGTVNDKLPDADPATFHSIKNWLGRDANHAYFKENIIRGANPATLKAEKYPMSSDGRDYFFRDAPLNVADFSSFKILHRDSDGDIWAVDKRCAYYDSIRIDGVDVATFKVDEFHLAHDSKRVYRFGEVLEGADPATFKEDMECGYATDKNHVWFYGKLLQDVDRATFKVDDKEADIAHDKFGKIIRGVREGAEQDEIETDVATDTVDDLVPESELIDSPSSEARKAHRRRQ